MLTIGLTGGIGAGKTRVANYFAELGVPVIDADEIARQIVAPGTVVLQQIVERFGQELLGVAGDLQRDKLRQIIFNDESARLWLESLLHPLIWAEMQRRSQTFNYHYAIWVIPLLVEKTLHDAGLDRILVVDVPEATQIQRLQQRDQLSTDFIQTILRSQTSRENRLAYAHDVIYNQGDLNDLRCEVERLHQYYLTLRAVNKIR